MAKEIAEIWSNFTCTAFDTPADEAAARLSTETATYNTQAISAEYTEGIRNTLAEYGIELDGENLITDDMADIDWEGACDAVAAWTENNFWAIAEAHRAPTCYCDYLLNGDHSGKVYDRDGELVDYATAIGQLDWCLVRDICSTVGIPANKQDAFTQFAEAYEYTFGKPFKVIG